MVEFNITILDAFRGRSVFITGATGFVGKVLLEKILRSCEGVKYVFILIRRTPDETVKERCKTLLDSQIFDRIRRECPDRLNKIYPLEGDITQSNFDLKKEDLKFLRTSVAYVFHCAANIRIDVKFSVLVHPNFIGTKNLLELCHSMPKLVSLVHFSTAYAFSRGRGAPVRHRIEERVYPEGDTDAVLESLRTMPTNMLNDRYDMINDKLSHYHFTKALAEIYIEKHRKSLPVCILRPSIITAAYREPYPGWVDSYAGPSGVIIGYTSGMLGTITPKKDISADLVPVDIVVNAAIAIARNIATAKSIKLLVLNCTASETEYLTWADIERICYPLIFKYPGDLTRHNLGGICSHMVRFCTIILMQQHGLLDYFIEYVQRPSSMVLYFRMHRILQDMHSHAVTKIDFVTRRMGRLRNSMLEEDKEIFSLDTKSLHWPTYFDNYIHGVRKYLLLEKDSTLEYHRKSAARLRLYWYISYAVVGLLALYFTWYLLF